MFGLLRLNWTEAHAVLPFTRLQAAAAVGLFGTPSTPVEVTLACSGADALALCLGAILAYPVTWRTRLAGAAGGAALILGLNTLRIGTLGRAAASPAWFNALHVYVWPAAAHARDRRIRVRLDAPRGSRARSGRTRCSPRHPPTTPAVIERPALTRRFVVLTVAFLLVFVAASPLYLESPGVLALAGFIARAAAATPRRRRRQRARRGQRALDAARRLPRHAGVHFDAADPGLSGGRLRLLDDVAAADPGRRSPRLPLFIALGIVRLLVVALPEVVASPLFFVHAFYQLLLGAVVVFLAALWRHGGRAAPRHALAGVIVGDAVRLPARSALHARGHLSGRRAARRSAGSDRVPSRVPGRPLSRAVGRGLRRRRLDGASSPGSRCSASRRRQACSRCTPSPATPA